MCRSVWPPDPATSLPPNTVSELVCPPRSTDRALLIVNILSIRETSLMLTTSLDSSSSSFGLYSAHFCSLNVGGGEGAEPGHSGVGIAVAAVHYALVYEVDQAGGGHLRVNAQVVLVIKGPQSGEEGGRSACTDLDCGAVGDASR